MIARSSLFSFLSFLVLSSFLSLFLFCLFFLSLSFYVSVCVGWRWESCWAAFIISPFGFIRLPILCFFTCNTHSHKTACMRTAAHGQHTPILTWWWHVSPRVSMHAPACQQRVELSCSFFSQILYFIAKK